MKPFVIIFLFIVSLISVRIAEASCLCFEDTATHVSAEGKVIEGVDHHSDSASDKDHNDHCQHNCSDCHFAALVPLSYIVTAPEGIRSLEPSQIILSHKNISSTVYRPPIL